MGTYLKFPDDNLDFEIRRLLLGMNIPITLFMAIRISSYTQIEKKGQRAEVMKKFVNTFKTFERIV